jgi:hypothetical protein
LDNQGYSFILQSYFSPTGVIYNEVVFCETILGLERSGAVVNILEDATLGTS